MSKLDQEYKRRFPAMQQAKRKLDSLLREVISTIEDRTLVRAQLSDLRIKTLQSLRRKAARDGCKAQQAITHSGDLVGGRVVCNNTEDVYRFVEILKERLHGDSGAFDVQDWIANPSDRGYRALHVNFPLDASQSVAPELVPCEVQIRTRLQDAWAELTHDDIYKQPDLPQDLRARSSDLAEVLAAADKNASDIRRRAVQEAVSPLQRTELRTVTSSALVFVFRDVFGRSPPEYVVQQALNVCEELGISSLEQLREIIARNDFREELSNAYQAIMPARLSPEELILAGLYALANGDRAAVRYVRRKARREFREIDAVYRRERLSSLPRSFDELVAQLDGGDSDAESWAAALEATDTCGVCGTTIIRPDALAERLIQHYDQPNSEKIRARIESAILHSGAECGGWDNSSLCSYHADQADKD